MIGWLQCFTDGYVCYLHLLFLHFHRQFVPVVLSLLFYFVTLFYWYDHENTSIWCCINFVPVICWMDISLFYYFICCLVYNSSLTSFLSSLLLPSEGSFLTIVLSFWNHLIDYWVDMVLLASMIDRVALFAAFNLCISLFSILNSFSLIILFFFKKISFFLCGNNWHWFPPIIIMADTSLAVIYWWSLSLLLTP